MTQNARSEFWLKLENLLKESVESITNSEEETKNLLTSKTSEELILYLKLHNAKNILQLETMKSNYIQAAQFGVLAEIG